MPLGKEAEDTMNTNFFGTLNVCKELFPLIRSNGRVVNVSSRLGLLGQVNSEELKNKVKNDNLTEDELVEIINDYIEYVFYIFSLKLKVKIVIY